MTTYECMKVAVGSLSLIIVVVGWMYVARKNLKLKRLKYRIGALTSFMNLVVEMRIKAQAGGNVNFTTDSNEWRLLCKAMFQFHDYGYKDEIEQIRNFEGIVRRGEWDQNVWDKIVELTRERIRKELGLPIENEKKTYFQKYICQPLQLLISDILTFFDILAQAAAAANQRRATQISHKNHVHKK